MLSPKATLETIATTLEENVDPLSQTHISKHDARSLIAKAIRATHSILHPGCNLDPGNFEIRLALLSLDTGPVRTGI